MLLSGMNMAEYFPYAFRYHGRNNGFSGGLILVGSGVDGHPGPALATDGDVREYLEANAVQVPSLKDMTLYARKKLVAANAAKMSASHAGKPPPPRLEVACRSSSLEITRDE